MNIHEAGPNVINSRQQKEAVSDGLEKAFLREMLKYAGPKPLEGAFGGGAGEDSFSVMMTESYADAVAEHIDLGISKGRGNE